MSTCTRELCTCEHFHPHKRFERNCAVCGHSKTMHPQREASPTRLLYSHLSRPVNHSETYTRLVRIIRESRSTVNLPSDPTTSGEASAESRQGHHSRSSMLGVRKSYRDASPDKTKELRESLSTAASMLENEQIEKILLGGKSPNRPISPYCRNCSRSPTPTHLTASPLHRPHSKSRRSLNVRSNSPLLKRLDVATHTRRHQASVESEYFVGNSAERILRAGEEALQFVSKGAQHKNAVSGVRWVAGKVVSVSYDYCGSVWLLPTSPQFSPSLTRPLHKAPVHAVAVSPDSLLMTSGADCSVRLWGSCLSPLLHTFKTPNDTPYALAVTAQNRLVAGGTANVLRIIDFSASSDTVQLFTREHTRSIRSIVSVSEHTVATGGGDGLLKLWDVRNRKSAATMFTREDGVNCLCALSEREICSGVESGVKVHDWRTLKEFEARRKTAPVTALAKVDDYLIVGSSVLEVETMHGLSIASFPTARVKSISFEENKRLLAVGASDCSLALWRLR